MKKLLLIILLLTGTGAVFGQTITLQGGLAFSKLKWNNFDFYDGVNSGAAVFLGVDYMDKEYINLSSHIGFLRKGGEETLTMTNDVGDVVGQQHMNAELDYLSVNTLLDIKYPLQRVIPFVSIGPRIDFLTSHNEILDYRDEDLKDISLGMILGGGLRYDLEAFQVGCTVQYYLNFNKVYNEGDLSIKDKTFTTMLMVGYKLGK